MTDAQVQGVVFNIQKFSVHDGEGIRTLVFLKGCPLRCRWCSNPESQNLHPEHAFNPSRCLTAQVCGRCLNACTSGALSLVDGLIAHDRSKCSECFACVRACPSGAQSVYGETMSVRQVLDKVEEDGVFYHRSGGGMTLSGGEALMQHEFANALLREARTRRIKTAVETCGMVSPDTIREAAPYLNYVLFDIKHMDSAVHEAQTGLPNRRILENFRILAEEFPDLPILARTPIIPGFNDSEEAIAAIAGFLKPFERVEYEMLPYHRLGTQKYQFLDRPVPMGDVKLGTEHMNRLQAVAQGILGDRLRIPH